MAGDDPDSQGGKQLLWNWPRGVDVEGSDGDFKLPDHSLHHLPQIPPRIFGRSRHRYRHPRGQDASSVNGLEGGGPTCDISGPAQGVWRLGQVQVPGNLGGVGRGPLIQAAPPEVVEAVENGRKGGRILRDGVSVSTWSDTGRSALPHHI